MFRKLVVVVFLFSVMINSCLYAVEGKWYTKDDDAIVEIYKDAEEDVYNGKITWLKEPSDEQGNEKVDNNNPDPDKRLRKRVGLEIVKGFTEKKKNKWVGGKIYDPDNGKTYSCILKLTKDDKLKVRGYIGVSLIGRTEIWNRANSINSR